MNRGRLVSTFLRWFQRPDERTAEPNEEEDANDGRRDPLEALPLELVLQICSLLPARDLVRLHDVSRGWRRLVETASLWQDLELSVADPHTTTSTSLLVLRRAPCLKSVTLTWRLPKKIKEALLANCLKFQTVKTLVCDDASWTLKFLRRVAPVLQDLEIVAPDKKHLAAVASMPLLRRLWVTFEPRDEPFVGLPATPHPSDLQWLRVSCGKGLTLLRMLHTFGPPVQELQLGVICREYPTDVDYHLTYLLPGLLASYGLGALQRFELGHDVYPENHDPADCRLQVAAILKAFPKVAVQCQLCRGRRTSSESESDCSSTNSSS